MKNFVIFHMNGYPGEKTIKFTSIIEFNHFKNSAYTLRFVCDDDEVRILVVGWNKDDCIVYGNTVYYTANFPTLCKFITRKNLESLIDSLP